MADSVRNPADEIPDITVHDATPHTSHTAHHYAARKPSDPLPDITVHEAAAHNSHDAHHYAARSFLSHAASAILLHAQGESFCIFGVADNRDPEVEWVTGLEVGGSQSAPRGTVLLMLIANIEAAVSKEEVVDRNKKRDSLVFFYSAAKHTRLREKNSVTQKAGLAWLLLRLQHCVLCLI